MKTYLALLVLTIIGACQLITVQTGEGHDTSRGVKVEATKGDTTIEKEKQ